MNKLILRELLRQFPQFSVALFCIIFALMGFFFVLDLGYNFENSLQNQARTMLGADAVISSNQLPISDDEYENLTKISDKSSKTMKFRTMLRFQNHAKLVEVKASDSVQPLVGAHILSNDSMDLSANSVYIAKNLAEQSHLKIGDKVNIGEAEFSINGIIIKESDSANGQFELGPRVMMRINDLAQTQLIARGSLINYRYNFLTDSQDALDKITAITKKLGLRLIQPQNAMQNFDQNTNRFTQYLGLIGLIIMVISMVALSQTIKLFLWKRQPALALMKSWGMSRQYLLTIHSIFLISIIALACIIGQFLAHSLAVIMMPYIASFLPVNIALSVPWSLGFLVLVLVLLWSMIGIFGYLYQYLAISPAVLFGNVAEISEPKGLTIKWRIMQFIALFLTNGILFAIFPNGRSILIFLAGLCAILAIFWLLSWQIGKITRYLSQFSGNFGAVWHHSILKFSQQKQQTQAFFIVMGIICTCNFTLILTKNSLIHNFSTLGQSLIPSYFLIDITDEELPQLQAKLPQFKEFSKLDAVPMLRGRITHFNDIEIEKIQAPADFQWVINADRAITFADEPPSNAEITQGKWWQKDTQELFVSLEEGTAQAFNLKIHDTIQIMILGRSFKAKIANFRRVNWQSLGVNFVMVFSSFPLASAPHNSMAALYSVGDGAKIMQFFNQEFPSISIVDIQNIMQDIQKILNIITQASQGFGLYSLGISGLIWLFLSFVYVEYNAQNTKLLFYMGFTPRQIFIGILWEFCCILVPILLISLLISWGFSWILVQNILKLNFIFQGSEIIGIILAYFIALLIFLQIAIKRAIN